MEKGEEGAIERKFDPGGPGWSENGQQLCRTTLFSPDQAVLLLLRGGQVRVRPDRRPEFVVRSLRRVQVAVHERIHPGPHRDKAGGVRVEVRRSKEARVVLRARSLASLQVEHDPEASNPTATVGGHEAVGAGGQLLEPSNDFIHGGEVGVAETDDPTCQQRAHERPGVGAIVGELERRPGELICARAVTCDRLMLS